MGEGGKPGKPGKPGNGGEYFIADNFDFDFTIGGKPEKPGMGGKGLCLNSDEVKRFLRC